MVKKPDIQYITQFYTYGSEAKAPELKPVVKKKKTVLPKAQLQQKIRIQVDPVACCGIVMAIVMVVMMGIGVNNYLKVCREYQAMTTHVITQQNINITTQQKYESMYNLADIEGKALALGMIPASEAEVIRIAPVIPEPVPQSAWWEDIVWFLKGLFA